VTLVLIRHGETALNVARVLQPADTALSERGERQALALARRLAPLGLRMLISSPLPRAWRTAQAVAAATGLSPQAEVRLEERNFGDFRGRRYDSLGFDPLAMLEAPPGGESAAAFAQRVAAVFESLRARYADPAGPVAVISHGLVIQQILHAHAPPAPGVWLPERVGNASLTLIEFDGTAPRATLVGCMAHLDSASGDDPQSLSGG
jgi:probable phosphoglycerate mutase